MLLNVDLSASVPKPEAVNTASPWSPTSRNNRPNQLKTAMSVSQSFFKGADVSASVELDTSAGPLNKRSDTLPANIGRGSTTGIRSSLVSNSSHQGGAAASSISGIISKALGKSDGFGAAGGSTDSDDDDYRYLAAVSIRDNRSTYSR